MNRVTIQGRFIFAPSLAAGILVILLPVFSISQAQQNLKQSKQKLEEEIENTNNMLEQTKKVKQSSLKNLQVLNRKIEKRENLIQTISKEIGNVDVELEAGNVMISRKTIELQKLKADYARMIYYAYRTMNQNDRLVFIFSARDFNQAYHRIRYYQQYASYRRQQAEKIRQTQLELSRRKAELEQVKGEKLTLVTQQEKERNKLARERQEKDKTVKELSKKEKELLATLKSKQKALASLQAEIEKLIAADRSGSRSSKGAGSSSELNMTPAEKKLSSGFAANRGRLPWPSDRGVVVSTFGEHPHPVLKYVKVKNNGIDILVANGTSVRSVFEGKVSRVLTVPNLNKVVIIRHGEYLTVYSNLGEVNVKDGQTVGTKEVIGKIKNDDEDGKSELHFEIWLGKTIQDPQEWLSN